MSTGSGSLGRSKIWNSKIHSVLVEQCQATSSTGHPCKSVSSLLSADRLMFISRSSQRHLPIVSSSPFQENRRRPSANQPSRLKNISNPFVSAPIHRPHVNFLFQRNPTILQPNLQTCDDRHTRLTLIIDPSNQHTHTHQRQRLTAIDNRSIQFESNSNQVISLIEPRKFKLTDGGTGRCGRCGGGGDGGGGGGGRGGGGGGVKSEKVKRKWTV